VCATEAFAVAVHHRQRAKTPVCLLCSKTNGLTSGLPSFGGTQHVSCSTNSSKSAFGDIPVARAIIPNLRSHRLIHCSGLVAESQQDFPVEENGRVVGIVTRANLLQALARQGTDLSVGEVMQQDFQVVDPSEMLETGFARQQNCHCRTHCL